MVRAKRQNTKTVTKRIVYFEKGMKGENIEKNLLEFFWGEQSVHRNGNEITTD